MYENLKVNKDRLTSPFDIHQTLHDIIDFPDDLTTEQVNISMYLYCVYIPISIII